MSFDSEVQFNFHVRDQVESSCDGVSEHDPGETPCVDLNESCGSNVDRGSSSIKDSPLNDPDKSSKCVKSLGFRNTSQNESMSRNDPSTSSPVPPCLESGKLEQPESLAAGTLLEGSEILRINGKQIVNEKSGFDGRGNGNSEFRNSKFIPLLSENDPNINKNNNQVRQVGSAGAVYSDAGRVNLGENQFRGNPDWNPRAHLNLMDPRIHRNPGMEYISGNEACSTKMVPRGDLIDLGSGGPAGDSQGNIMRNSNFENAGRFGMGQNSLNPNGFKGNMENVRNGIFNGNPERNPDTGFYRHSETHRHLDSNPVRNQAAGFYRENFGNFEQLDSNKHPVRNPDTGFYEQRKNFENFGHVDLDQNPDRNSNPGINRNPGTGINPNRDFSKSELIQNSDRISGASLYQKSNFSGNLENPESFGTGMINSGNDYNPAILDSRGNMGASANVDKLIMNRRSDSRGFVNSCMGSNQFDKQIAREMTHGGPLGHGSRGDCPGQGVTINNEGRSFDSNRVGRPVLHSGPGGDKFRSLNQPEKDCFYRYQEHPRHMGQPDSNLALERDHFGFSGVRDPPTMAATPGYLTRNNTTQNNNENGFYYPDNKYNKQRIPRPSVTPDRFEGKVPWRDYLAHFERASNINGWNDAEKAHFLSVALKGQAQQVLGDIPSDFTYAELVLILERRFGSVERAEVHLAELRGRCRKPGESLPECGQAIRRLTALAYPEMDTQAQDRLARIHFSDALQDERLRLSIFQAHPSTLDDAIRTALEMESYLQSEKMKPRPRPTVRALGTTNDVGDASESETTSLKKQLAQITEELNKFKNADRRPRFDKSEVVCYKCGEKGHFKRNCKNQAKLN